MAGEPSPALSSSGRAGPPQAALRRLPSVSPTNRPRRATSAGTSEGKRALNQGERHTEPFGGETERAEREHQRQRAPRLFAFYKAGLRPSLRPVRGSSSLLEASQKGAFLTPDRVSPRVHQSGASHPTPLLSHSSEKQAGELGGRILGGKSRT